MEVHFGQGGVVWSILRAGRAWLGNNRNLSGVRDTLGWRLGVADQLGRNFVVLNFWSHPKPAKFMRDLSLVSASIDSRCRPSIKLLGALQCWCIMIYSGDSMCGHKKQRSKWWEERNEAKVTTPIMFNHLTGPIWRRNNHNFSSASAAFYPSSFTCIYSGAGGSHSTLFV